MPASSSGTYGTYNPGGIDPFPIESTLAQIVGTNNPAQAGNLLDTYRLSNTISADNYDYMMNQQHEYAKQQLAQQLYEKELAAATEGVKTRGGLSVAAAMSPNIASHISSLIPSIEGGLTNLQNADIALKGGGALEHLVNAGYPANSAQASQITGGVAGPQGVPLKIQEANIHAASAANTAAGDKTSVQMPADPNFPGAVITEKPRKGETYQAFRDRMIAENRVPGQVQLPNIPSKTTSAAPPNQTNVPNAPPAQRVQSTSPGADPVQKAVSDHVERVVRTQNPTAYNDIMQQAQKNGGRVQMIRDAKGNVVGVQGATKAYTQ
jgi:hypothetical protein